MAPAKVQRERNKRNGLPETVETNYAQVTKIVRCLVCDKPHGRTEKYWNIHPSCGARSADASPFDPAISQFAIHTSEAKKAMD